MQYLHNTKNSGHIYKVTFFGFFLNLVQIMSLTLPISASTRSVYDILSDQENYTN